MKSKFNVFLLLILSLLLSYGAGCQDTGRFAVSGTGGTLGLGGEFSAKLATDINARVGINSLDYDFDGEDIDDVEYDFGVKLSSISALVDWHIFDDSFHLTGGFISMNNKVELDARPTKSEEIGDMIFTPAQLGVLTGDVEIDGLSPYFGIGWGNPFASNRRWGFTLDLGVAFTDSPDVSLNSIGGTWSSNPTLLAQLEKERKNIEDDLDSLQFYPVIQLGLFVRF